MIVEIRFIKLNLSSDINKPIYFNIIILFTDCQTSMKALSD